MKKIKLLFAAAALMLGGSVWAQTDVTSTYITNAGFDDCTAETSNVAAKTIKNYSSNGWTNANTGSFTTIAVTAYGGGVKVANSTTPSTKKDGTTVSGNTLGIIAGWGDDVKIQSGDITLPAGRYTLTVDHYLSSETTNYGTSRFGFVTSGTSYIVSSTSYTASTWTTETVTFALAEETTGKIQIGLIGNNKVGSGAPAVFYDDITLEYIPWDTYTYNNPWLTDFVVNGTFDSNTTGWTKTAEVWSNNIASNQYGAFTVPFYENWDGSAKVNKMYQTINNIPNGTYRLNIAAFVNTLADPNESQYVFANNDKVYLTTGEPTAYQVWTYVTTNSVEIGLEQTTATANWMGIDNVSLEYYGPGDVRTAAQIASHKLAWEEAKAAAETAIANDDYANVTGSEKTALQTEIDKAEPTTAAGYDEAAADLISATSTFTASKTNYDIFATYNVTLSYADADKKPTITSESTAATILPALRAYYESNALAESVDGAVNMTSSITNANDPANNDGWTWTGNKNNPASNESWTDADGTNDHSYFDGGNWGANSWTTTMSQNITLPAGTYLLTAKGRAAENTTLTMAVGEDDIALPHVGSTGNVFDRGWGDASLEFTTDGHGATILVTATSSTIHEWFSIADFRLMRLSLNTSVYAGETEYDALNSAISTAEAKTLGFEKDQYAPYNNVAAIQALAAAKAIDQEAELTNFKTDVEEATSALTSATWIVNDTDVDAIYNGTFAETGTGNNPKGWTRSNNGWGQQITGLTAAANDVASGTTTAWYYNNNGAWQYGNDGVYTMPLAENQTYELSFKYRKHNTDWQSWMKASVLNSSDEGMEAVEFAAAEDGTTFVTAKAYFTTGAAGNYILSIEQSGNAHLTDVSLVKAASATLALDEDETTYEATDRTYYERVTLERTIKANKWNTFCVPFDMTAAEIDENAEVMKLKSAEQSGENYTLTFDDATSIVAGKPYMVRVTGESDITSINLTGKTISSTITPTEADGVTFTGTYTNGYAPLNSFIISNNNFYLVDTDKNDDGISEVTLKAFRGYITVEAAGVKALNYVFDDDATGIDSLTPALSEGKEAIYNLAGQRIQKMQKGINIVNGRKVMK